MTPTNEVRGRLNELGVKYTTDDSNDYEIVEWQGPYNLWWQFVYDPYEEEPYGELRLVETGGATHLTPEQAIAATVELNKTTVKKDRECQYCRRRMADRKSVRTMSHEAWVNVEYRTLDIAVYGHEGFVPITHCPWCGREL